MSRFEPGAVFRWVDFPHPRHNPEDRKPRWFIFLGRSDVLSQPVYAHFCTTTTQFRHFEPGGSRSKHDVIKFSKESSPFGEDCILDCDEAPYTTALDRLENEGNIEIAGRLPEQTLRQIYSRLLRSDGYSFAVLCDIYRSFNHAGITGLKKPRRP